MRMDPPKFREKVLIGLETAPLSFDVRGKVVGPNGANLQYITNETGAIVTIRGKGSGFLEPNTNQESIEPLHICVEHSKYEVLQAGRQLAFNLIETVQQEWTNSQQEQQQQPQIATQAQQIQPLTLQVSQTQQSEVVSSGTNVVSTSMTLPVFSQQTVEQLVSVPPPTLTVPPPTLHIPQQTIQNIAQGSETNQSVHEIQTSQSSAIQHPSQALQIQSQPQQVYVSNQGTLIQQPMIPPNSVLQQPQIITQATYPIQYMQTSTGQLVAYPNLVRPNDGSGQTQQVMLLQYGQPGVRPTVRGHTPQAQQQTTLPQIVQIVNPQTGQIQHVLQHVQPQIHMQQLQLQQPVVGQGGNMLGQQILMPLQTPIQFTSQPQQMIITQPPPMQQIVSGQITTSAAQQITPQSSTITLTHSNVRQTQAQKRRFETEVYQQFQANHQKQEAQQNQIQLNRKGIGGDIQLRGNTSSQNQIQENSSEKQLYVSDEWRNDVVQGDGNIKVSETSSTPSPGLAPDPPKRGRPSNLDGEGRIKPDSKQITYKLIQQPQHQQIYSSEQQYQHVYQSPAISGGGQNQAQQMLTHQPPPQIYQQPPQGYNPYNHWVMPQ